MDMELLWGQSGDLTVLQMCIRGLVIFWVCYLLLRIGGKRIFGKKSAFDYVIIIILGSVLARIVVGASPFLPTVAAALVMAVMNRILAKLCGKFPTFDNWLNGKAILLYADREIIWKNLQRASLSLSELKASLRLELKTDNLDRIEMARLENNGRISFIVKENSV